MMDFPQTSRTEDLSESLKLTESYKLRTRSYTRWSPVEEGVTLSWNDVNIYTRMRYNGKVKFKRIINGVTGAVKAGSLLALMGASGSGKSTLMMALAHRNSGDISVEGDILVNGRRIGDYMKYISGCMYQEDIFIGSLTVWEHMYIMSHLKLDKRFSFEDRQLKIHKILRDLGIFQCLHSRIGTIGGKKTLSGGEKKRLSFATELLTDPPILFCDEPTTGLDSFSAQKLVSMMNAMTSNGKTILCTIHQPSSDIFAMFSQIILLSEGRTAYMGTRTGALDFFNSIGFICPKTHNPADYFIRVLATPPGYETSSRNAVKRICDNFLVSDYGKEVDILVQYEFHMERSSILEGIQSSEFIPTSRITQGSNLGPELFIVFINDLMDNIHSPHLMFALKPYPEIRSQDNGVQLQLALDHVASWCEDNYLRFNEFEVRSKFQEARYLTKLYFLIYRWFLDIVRDPTIQILGILQKIAIGLMVGLCYFDTEPLTQNGVQAVQGMSFLLISENTFSPMYTVLETFPRYHALFVREYQSGLYALPSYYASRILATIPGLLIEPVLYVFVAYWLAGLASNAFLYTILAAVLTMNVSCACGIFFSSAFDSSEMAMQYLIPFDCIMLVTCGIFINLSTLSSLISWTKYFSWMMYSYEIITIVQWKDVRNITCNNPSGENLCLTDGAQVLDKFSFSEDNITRDIIAMILLCIFFYMLGFVFLWKKIQRKQ